VEWVQGQWLEQPEATIHEVFFPLTGWATLLACLEGAPALAVGMVGAESMLGLPLVLGVAVNGPLAARVQGAGSAWRMARAPFLRALDRSLSLRRALHRAIARQMLQLTVAAACAHGHQLAPRLASWLLRIHDHAAGAPFDVTHDLLAQQLGVRRVGVTVAASALQRSGLIAYHRGHLTVLNRAGLEAAACGCYEAERQALAAMPLASVQLAG
jgi:CRP-like cAMP-binding protein